jgi:hypothetical protein
MCEMLTVAGKKLDELSPGAKPADKKRVEGYFVILEKWSKNKALASRIRFMLRDVLDLRKSKWVPRRENLQVRQYLILQHALPLTCHIEYRPRFLYYFKQVQVGVAARESAGMTVSHNSARSAADLSYRIQTSVSLLLHASPSGCRGTRICRCDSV